MKHCDKCKGEIIKGACPCGFWIKEEDLPPYLTPFLKAVLQYNELHAADAIDVDGIFGGDHHSGTCFVFFRGDFHKCEKVKEYARRI